MLPFATVKGSRLYLLIAVDGLALADALPRIWDDETAALFAAVVSFWFGARSLAKAWEAAEPMRHVTSDGIALIKRFEGFSPTIYVCPGGWPSIGFGHVVLEVERDRFAGGISEDEAEWSCPYESGHAAVADMSRMNSLGERMPSRLWGWLLL